MALAATFIPAPLVFPGEQLPLIHLVGADEIELMNSPNAVWYDILARWDWRPDRDLAAQYYEALYRFNLEAKERRALRELQNPSPSEESKGEAQLRLLRERLTGGNEDAEVLQVTPPPPKLKKLRPEDLAPGRIPPRFAGRQPKCFFSLHKSFVGVLLMGHCPEPESVHRELNNNPTFARICGFTQPDESAPYAQTHIPSLRKLEQFDQLMTENGLWSKQKWDEVRRNLEEGAIRPEEVLVHDTVHFHAFSSFETVKYEDQNGTEQKKSQSKPTKRCGCADKESCGHPWEPCDQGAGTVVKSSNRMHWAHKASVLGLPDQGVPLDAVAMSDAPTHDSQSLIPNVLRLYQEIPDLPDWFRYLLDDSAAYDQELFKQVRNELQLTLRASINPRRRQTLKEDLPRGMDRLTPYGELYCLVGHAMEYRGTRKGTERFIYGPPLDDCGRPRCATCPLKDDCCPHATNGRQATISFDLLPHLRPEDPPMAKRHKAMMKKRPAIERIIKRIKCDFGGERLTKRGNEAFQARLDKSLIAIHVLVRHQA